MTARDEEDKKTCIEVIKTLADASHVMGSEYVKNAKTMTEIFHQEHRTIQQNIVRLMAYFIHEVAKVDDKFTDLRNEDAIKWVKKVDSQTSQTERSFQYV